MQVIVNIKKLLEPAAGTECFPKQQSLMRGSRREMLCSDTCRVICRRLFSYCCSGWHKRSASVIKGSPGQGRDHLLQHPALPGAAPDRGLVLPPAGLLYRWIIFPFPSNSPSLDGSSSKDKPPLPWDFMSLTRTVEAATSQSPGWHLSILSAQTKPVFLLCVRGLIVKPFVLTLSLHCCLFAAPQFPASALNPSGTCLIFSCDHQREKQGMQNTPNRDILMRGGNTVRHECSFKVTKSQTLSHAIWRHNKI